MTDVREQLQRAQAGDKEARNYLVQENIGLVKHIVSRYTARGVEKEDLFQIGMIGLLKAIDYFDLSYDVRFSTYAVPMIAGEIRRFMRDNGAIKVSRSIKDNRAAVNRSREQLLEKLGREPTLSEIVKDVGMSMEDVLLAVNSGQEVASLQQTIYDGDGSSIRLMDKLSARSGEGDAALDRMMLAVHCLHWIRGREKLLFSDFIMIRRSHRLQKGWGYLRYRYPGWRSGYSEK